MIKMGSPDVTVDTLKRLHRGDTELRRVYIINKYSHYLIVTSGTINPHFCQGFAHISL